MRNTNYIYTHNLVTSNLKINNNLDRLILKFNLGVMLSLDTDFLIGADITSKERVYCLWHNIHDQPYCEQCNIVPLRLKQSTCKYPQFCSTKCSANNNNTVNKRHQTKLQKYGNKIGDMIKRETTCMLRYNAKSPLESTIVQNKISQINFERYGASNPFNSHSIKEQIKQTNMVKYGVEFPFQSTNIQDKCISTYNVKYGMHHRQYQIVDAMKYLNSFNWLNEQYVNNSRTCSDIATSLGVKSSTTIGCYLKKHNIPARSNNLKYSHTAICWLESIMQSENIFIQHAENIGEYTIPGTKYKADGYCSETNTIYEFHGDCFHGNPRIFEPHIQCSPYSTLTAEQLYTKTIIRENLIKSLGYNLIIIWSSEL